MGDKKVKISMVGFSSSDEMTREAFPKKFNSGENVSLDSMIERYIKDYDKSRVLLIAIELRDGEETWPDAASILMSPDP